MIAVVGDRESVFPFKVFGVSTFEAEDADEMQEVLAQMTPDEYTAVFITEELMQGLEELQIESALNITVIPGQRGSLGYGRLLLKELIKKATGAEVAV